MGFTKGDWRVVELEEPSEYAIFSFGTFIATTKNIMVNKEPTRSEKRANAELIALAPRMIERIEQMITELESIEQEHIDENPKCFATIQFRERLVDRLNEVINKKNVMRY